MNGNVIDFVFAMAGYALTVGIVICWIINKFGR